MKEEGYPKAFYLPRRIAPKLPKDRLRSLEHQIVGEIKMHISMKRGSNKHTSFNLYKGLAQRLEQALDLHENRCLGDEHASYQLEEWKKNIQERAPPRSEFLGRAINYSYTDAKRVRKHLLSTCKEHLIQSRGIEFMLAVKCFAYYCGVCSVWVFFGTLDRNDTESASEHRSAQRL